MFAIADTGPLLHLSLVDAIYLLPELYEKVLIPGAVADELSHTLTPRRAFVLIGNAPLWLERHTVSSVDKVLDRVELGEREAITLAVSKGADIFLTDDAGARNIAVEVMGLQVAGTIGVLRAAAEDESIAFGARDFDQMIERLWSTNFRKGSKPQEIVERMSLRLHSQERSSTR